ncbi:MAG: linear amide C-N hydrolase [Candidatus Latescibacteria bacterium]|nr:linear amide C-N hydrolase [Candidatus Latescibacterota bacterium]NIO57258.1 linear amide C-N hydrolase [Candidatus Latescibacterota bacterium]
MLKRLAFLPALLLLACIASETGHTCSTFCLGKGDKTVFGKNFDYHMGYGVVIINKRNVAKHAATFSNPAQWVSKYGSVTFNMYGREMPMGGMNEAGLVVDNMWMDSSTYPEPDSRPAVNTLQWIQYQLDNCGTVAEVIATDSLIRINSDSPSKIHYLVCDRNGDCASIEFIDGERVIHSGKSFPVHVLTNSR